MGVPTGGLGVFRKTRHYQKENYHSVGGGLVAIEEKVEVPAFPMPTLRDRSHWGKGATQSSLPRRLILQESVRMACFTG